MANSNIELLVRVAEALGELRERLVFVGGTATALLITDPAAAEARVTADVDAIVAIVSLAEYHRLGDELRNKGFSQTLAEGEPPYRWTIAGMKLDVMPLRCGCIGFLQQMVRSCHANCVRGCNRGGAFHSTRHAALFYRHKA